MPKIRVAHIVTPLVAVAAVVTTYLASASMLDRPIRSIEINGPFQRVTALQIEEAISDQLEDGFVSADLTSIQQSIVALPWIDEATVARRWPSRLRITVTEQVPAAIWGERGLLNVRGELFVTDARHIPAELPPLSGPENRSGEVAKRYLDVRDRLIPVGLDLRRVSLDPRGAWDMTLLNGVEVRAWTARCRCPHRAVPRHPSPTSSRAAPRTSSTSTCVTATDSRSAGITVPVRRSTTRTREWKRCSRYEGTIKCRKGETRT